MRHYRRVSRKGTPPLAMPTRKFMLLILLTQSACVAVGLGLNQLYVRSSLAQVEQEEARNQIESQLHMLTPQLQGQTAQSLGANSAAWQQLLLGWRARAGGGDRLLLVNEAGHILASSDAQAATNTDSEAQAAAPSQDVKWLKVSGRAGHVEETVRGLVADPMHGSRVAIAWPLANHDGYVLLTRAADNQKIEAASLQKALWSAGTITLLWTLGLLGATLYLAVSYFQQGESRDRALPQVDLLKQAQALVRTQETVIFGLAKLSDSRDPDTGDHLERIAHYSAKLASALRHSPDFRELVSLNFVQLIGISSALHDIGKVGIEDSILKKPGKLTSDERRRMQLHTRIGEDCLREIERRLGASNFLAMAREIAAAHHERWDGQGYPRGLSGERIPLAARIVAIADVYDALSSKRVYKSAIPHDECVEIIRSGAGTHFDPRLVEAFLQVADNFGQFSRQFQTERARRSVDDGLLSPPPREALDEDAARYTTASIEQPEHGTIESMTAKLDETEAMLLEAHRWT